MCRVLAQLRSTAGLVLALCLAGQGCTVLFEASGDGDGDGGMEEPPQIDAGVGMDREIIDDPDELGCGQELPGTIVRFPVDGSEETGNLHTSNGVPLGDVVHAISTADSQLERHELFATSGPGDCGNAMDVKDRVNGSFARISNGAFDGVKSFDFWFNLEAPLSTPANFGALLSKDASGKHDGDLMVILYDGLDGINVGMRIQSAAGDADTYVICSGPHNVGEWHHVAVSLTDPVKGAELFVDGESEPLTTGSFGGTAVTGNCAAVDDMTGPARYMSLDSNSNDWFWGASNNFLLPNGAPSTNPPYYIVPVKLDELRFRSVTFSVEEAQMAYDAVMLP